MTFEKIRNKFPFLKIIALGSIPLIALFIAHFIWAVNFVVAKVTLNEFPTMSLAFLRFSLASLLLIPFLTVFEKKHLKIKPKHFLRLFIIGILMVTVNIALFFEGLIRTSAINASALSMSIPIFSVLVGWWFLKEKIYWVNLIGILIGLFGALTIIGLPVLFASGFSSKELMGNLLIILSGISSVIGMILLRSMLKIYHPIVLSAVMFFVGTITFFLPALLEYFQNPSWVSNVSILGLLGLFYMAILSSIVAYFLMTYGLSKIGIVKTNLFHYMEPAVAATFAVPFLGERISYSFIIGTCLVVLGVYWGTLGKQDHHHPHLKHHRA